MLMLKERRRNRKMMGCWGKSIIEWGVVGWFICRWKAFRTKLDILQLCIFQQRGDRYMVRTLPGKA